MEIIHQQVQRKKEKMARLADLQRRPQHRELRQEGLFNEDGWYDDFNHDAFTFDDASPLAAELEATPWPHHTSHLSSPCMMGTQIQSSF
jgi:hypothetical protein